MGLSDDDCRLLEIDAWRLSTVLQNLTFGTRRPNSERLTDVRRQVVAQVCTGQRRYQTENHGIVFVAAELPHVAALQTKFNLHVHECLVRKRGPQFFWSLRKRQVSGCIPYRPRASGTSPWLKLEM